jgi:hypothetical protein
MAVFVVGKPRSPVMLGLLALEAAAKKGKVAKTEPQLAHPKENAARSEEYRRLVAALPCYHCGVVGHSQAAHPPPTGKGIKESDLECFPLCTLRKQGRKIVEGCHKPFDNYELIPKARMPAFIRKAVRSTQEQILAAGDWPKKLAKPAWSKKP